MKEYFVMTNSFAAPFFSDTDSIFVMAENPSAALEHVAAAYKHPCGLYAAVCYESADAYHKNSEPLAKWICNRQIAQMEATKDLRGGYSILGLGPGEFVLNGEHITVNDPKQGRVVLPECSGDKR